MWIHNSRNFLESFTVKKWRGSVNSHKLEILSIYAAKIYGVEYIFTELSYWTKYQN